jgi:hypothetical protein
VAVFLDLDEVEGTWKIWAHPQLGGRASEEGGELAAVEKIVTCGGGAEVAEDEVLGHAVVRLSHEELAVKEKRFTREGSMRWPVRTPHEGKGRYQGRGTRRLP